MLTPEQWETIAKQASQIYNQLELDIIEEIATRIASVGYANTVIHNDVLIAQEMGMHHKLLKKQKNHKRKYKLFLKTQE